MQLYELEAAVPLPGFAEPFAWLPPATAGLLLWVVCVVAAVAYAFRVKGSAPTRMPMLLAAGIYTGLYMNFYSLVDEVMINLEHAYNLYHHGKFSISSADWVDGTVELLYYLPQALFADSQQSLIVGNFLFSYVVGLLHLLLVGRIVGPGASGASRTVQICGFALCTPVVTTFASGFGNGMVSLGFLAAIAAAVNRQESRSLVWSGLLPLARPDAILLSVVNAVVIAGRRRFSKSDVPLLLLPLFAMAAYYSAYRVLFGHWIPMPVRFKALHPSMLEMTSLEQLGAEFGKFLVNPVHAIALWMLVGLIWRWTKVGKLDALGWRQSYLMLYVIAAFPLFVFYAFGHSTIGDFSFWTYTRYWSAFDVALAVLLVTCLVDRYASAWAGAGGGQGGQKGGKGKGIWVVALLIGLAMQEGLEATQRPRGRDDGIFAGAFSELYLPRDMTIATTEMNTFGLMIERPVGDLWGYSTPAIALSRVCNGDRVRSNSNWFLQSKPDLYWPYWFTRGLVGEIEFGDYDRAEAALATFHHTGKRGNLLGDMRQVLAEYDLVIIRDQKPRQGQLAYLVRSEVRSKLLNELTGKGFRRTRERALNREKFDRLYGDAPPISYPCG